MRYVVAIKVEQHLNVVVEAPDDKHAEHQAYIAVDTRDLNAVSLVDSILVCQSVTKIG